ncbi:hypothetical protein NST41_14375 [Paenibacillus sp. FSL L8-0696]|uniref:hypothetical protein n=1 Tax=Paenibacillus sp. FSL L8-0696 TaxID=2954524 RepID=UPI003119306D
MALYMVSYDLHGLKKDYDKITKGLVNLGSVYRVLESQFLVSYAGNASQLRDYAATLVNSQDEIFVSLITSDWASMTESPEELLRFINANM